MHPQEHTDWQAGTVPLSQEKGAPSRKPTQSLPGTPDSVLSGRERCSFTLFRQFRSQTVAALLEGPAQPYHSFTKAGLAPPSHK